MKYSCHLGVVLVSLVLFGCSGDDEAASRQGDHVWKEQTDTLDKAREVEDVQRDAAERQRRAIDGDER